MIKEKVFVIKFSDETKEEALNAGIFKRRSDAEKEARLLIVEGYAPDSFEILEIGPEITKSVE